MTRTPSNIICCSISHNCSYLFLGNFVFMQSPSKLEFVQLLSLSWKKNLSCWTSDEAFNWQMALTPNTNSVCLWNHMDELPPALSNAIGTGTILKNCRWVPFNHDEKKNMCDDACQKSSWAIPHKIGVTAVSEQNRGCYAMIYYCQMINCCHQHFRPFIHSLFS